jgi:putative Mg2+ transporter-C (MgtC) family protein
MNGMLQEALFASATPSSLAVAAVKLSAAMLLGGLLGLDRELRDRPAGLRTYMLVSLAACLFALIALALLEMPAAPDGRLRFDPLRLIEATTAGVAFLAAGTILARKGRIKGLTTGAGMWLAGAIGLACGLGHGALAALATVLGLVVLTLLRLLEPRADE